MVRLNDGRAIDYQWLYRRNLKIRRQVNKAESTALLVFLEVKMSQIEMIDELLAANNPELWKSYIPSFIELYVRKSSITALGVVLTRDHIRIRR